MGFFNVFYEMIHAEVIKAHSVDQPLGFDQAEQTRLIITRLWTRRDGTDFDGTKAHRAQGINALAIFIQTCRQTQRVFKGQTHALHRFFRHVLTHQRGQRRSRNTA